MRTISFVRTGIAAFTATALSVLAAPPAPGFAAPLSMTLSTVTGPSGGGNVVTGTINATGNVLAFPPGQSQVVQFQYVGTGATACRATAKENAQIAGTATTLTNGVLTIDPADVRPISTTRIAFTVPASSYPATVDGSPSTVNTTGLSLLEGQVTSKWNVCVYDSASTTASTLIATSAYTIAVRPQITAILPARGPALGGQRITVNGVGFGTGTTATIDGSAVTDVKLSANGNSFSALTPAHAGGSGYPLVVKTVGGTVSSADPDNNGQPEDNDVGTPDAPILFGFDNSITVSPNTAPAGSTVYLDVRGVGFYNLAFDQSGSAPLTDGVSRVFLVRDAYDAAGNRGVQECDEVVVLDDTELVCQLDLAADRLDPITSAAQNGQQVAVGAYFITVVSDASPLAGGDAGATIVTSGATFTVAPY